MMEGLLSVPVLQPMEPSRDPWGGGGAAGSPALLHLGGRCSVLLQSSTPGPGEREMLSPLPSPSSSAPCAHTAATWRPGWLPAAHRGRTVPVLQLPWGRRALHPGDLTDGVEWMGGCWPRCSFRCDERSCGDAMSHRWERVPPQWVALGGGVGTGGRVMFSGCGEAQHRGIPWAVCAERSLRLCAPVVCWPAVVLHHYGVWGVWRVRLLQGDAHCMENGAQGPCHGEWGWLSDKSVPCSALHAGWPSLPS